MPCKASITSIRDILFQVDAINAGIEEREKHALFFTLHHLNSEYNPLQGKDERVLEKIEAFPFFVNTKDETCRGTAGVMALSIMIAQSLDVDPFKCAVIEGLKGVLFLVEPTELIATIDFEDMRPHVDAVRSKLQLDLRALYPHAVVEDLWRVDALISLPSDKSKIISSALEPQEFHIMEKSGLLEQAMGVDVVAPQVVKNYPPPDTESILEGCLFLKERGRSPKSFAERAAILSILGHVAGKGTAQSMDIVHEFASHWKDYDHNQVDIETGKQLAYGPRTCANVNKVCEQLSLCSGCPHFGKRGSPVSIKGGDFISTEGTGFHRVTFDNKGMPKKTPDYEGLRRFYKKDSPYTTISESEGIFKWNGKIWVPVFDLEIKAFAQKHFNPECNTLMANEFFNLVHRNELRNHSWFGDSTEGKMNFQNGILTLETMMFESHNPKYGFRTVLPYDYDPLATCPNWEKFLRDVTLDRPELMDIIMEMTGYSLSGDKCWEQKAIVLLGEGQNGKSKLVSIVKALAGDGASTSQTFIDLEKDTNRAALDGSLFNIAEETPSKSLMDSSLFKALIGGAEVSVKKLYQQPYEIRNRAKFWMLCNEMPRSADKAHAMLRRLCIVPFDAMFTGTSDDKRIEDKLMPELSGILNMALLAYDGMKVRKGLTESEIAKEKLNQYREENDNVWRWFNYACEDLGPMSEEWLHPREVYESYRKFAEDEGEKPATMPSFTKRLSILWKPYGQRKSQKRTGPEGEKQRVILGIKIKPEYRVRLMNLSN